MTNDSAMLRTLPNFRDIGGYRTGSGARVRTGLVYRADSLSRIDDGDFTVLAERGLRQVLDLRTVHERSAEPDRVPEGAEYAVLDVQGDHTTGGDLNSLFGDPRAAAAALGGGGAEAFMHEVNRALVTTDDAHAGYRELVERTAAGPTAVVFHCTAGKDRTGWAAALLLTLLGVSRDTVFEDYLASNARMDRLRGMVRRQAERGGIDPALMEPIVQVRRSYLETAFTELERVYGSFDGYVADGLKLTPRTVDRLRDRLLEG
ncbi:tyrosine-protein phosphatase [Nocardiopsis composta]|uniref:Protein-tyrosine phosphatase n=1 Tax=Nocardiopsis composta TaxID=157465 RepID=A0A7W8QT19_9ACTN|nr:tyrosine-protein phosphatase [Nocardiopsis composta]MBB5435408.1 protein-tyrosine phosphatase [Nocardiopsis composta]